MRPTTERSRLLSSSVPNLTAVHLGYRGISEVRQGKFFEIALDSGTTREQAHKDIDVIARDVLTNPVIEEYRVEFLD